MNQFNSPEKEYKNKLRVFISYSHEDRDLVELVVKVLEKKVTVMWDKKLILGRGLNEQIKTFIAHSHIFLPVITKSSSKRGWVQQEIGYGKAMNIPVLPLSYGELPGEMIQETLAIRLSEDRNKWEAQLEEDLQIELFENLISDFEDSSYARYQCARFHEDRAKLLTEYANSIRKIGYYGMVRQKGALSSFHIPDKSIDNKIWKIRYGKSECDESKKYELLREERIALQRHADVCGCRLIIDPSIKYESYGVEARIVRLESLLEFLESPNAQVQIAFNEGMNIEENVTIVGDWFSAEAISASLYKGYQQTILTRHAPSVLKKIELFDQKFEESLQNQGWEVDSSKENAIKALKELITNLKR